MVILAKSQRVGERVMHNLTRYLETRLKLKVNPAKSKVAPMSGYRFLGFTLRGWFGYFGISEYYRPIPELDEWLRRRVRMCTGNSGVGRGRRSASWRLWASA